jgi:hypothetical protein
VSSATGGAGDGPGLDAGARDLGEAWRFGVLASRSLAEQLLEMYAELGAGFGGGHTTPDEELRRLRIDVDRAVELSLDVFDRILGLTARLQPQMSGPGAGNGAAPPQLVVSGPPGNLVRGRLWVHNVSAETVDAPRLRCGPLESFDGVRIPPSCLEIVSSADPIEARSSRLVELVADVPEPTPPGSYLGLVMSSDPDVLIRCRLDVTNGSARPAGPSHEP